MSYDIDVGREWFNYTSNGSAIFYDHMLSDPEIEQRGGLWVLDGLTGAQASKLIADAFDAISDTQHRSVPPEGEVGARTFCAKYDPPNGWGSTVGAILFLARIQGACVRNPRAKVKVSA